MSECPNVRMSECPRRMSEEDVPRRRPHSALDATGRDSAEMIEQLRRVAEAHPELEPFLSGTTATSASASSTLDLQHGRGRDDADGSTTTTTTLSARDTFKQLFLGSGAQTSSSSTTTTNAGANAVSGSFDAVEYARAAFSRSRANASNAAASSSSSTAALTTVTTTTTTTGSTLDDVARLAEGARTLENSIREEVIAKRGVLERTLGGVKEAEETMRTVRAGADALADAMRRVARELSEPHAAVEETTRTLERVMSTADTIRRVVKILKLTSKLRETWGGEDADNEPRRRDSSELSKAAKLLGEIKLAMSGDHADELRRVDVVAEQLPFIDACSKKVSKEATASLDRAVDILSQAELGAALQVHYNLNELSAVVDQRVSFHAASAVDAVKDAMDPHAVGEGVASISGDPQQGAGMRRGRQLVAPPQGAEREWMHELWRRVDAAMDGVHRHAMSVWHLQRVLAKKRDPLTQTLFLDVVVGKAASTQALCDKFWAYFAKGMSEHLARAHAAAGFVSGALVKDFPRLIGALEGAVSRCGRDADAAKGAPGCIRRDGSTRSQVLRAVEPIASAFFARSLTRLTDSASACFSGGRVIDAALADKFLSRVRGEVDAVAEYDNLLSNACGNVSSALKTLAERAKRAIGRSVDAANLTEDPTPTQIANAQIAEQLSRVHALLSKVLPSFAPAPRRALEVGLEHVASAIQESTRPLFDAVGDWCDARFAQMHASAGEKSAYVMAVTSTLAHVADVQPGLFRAAAGNGALQTARLRLAERVMRSFVDHASLARDVDQGFKMRIVKECGEIETALSASFSLLGAEQESPAFKCARAFKSLILLPTESIDGSPLVRDVAPRVLLHHLYSRASADLHTPAKRASLSVTQYASWVNKKATDAEIWRGIKGTLDVYAEAHARQAENDVVVVSLMRKIGEERMAA